MTQTTNPLLDYAEFAPYSKIQATNIEPAVNEALEIASKKLDAILNQNPDSLSFESTLLAFDEMGEEIDKAWTPVENLLSLMGSDEIRTAAEKARPKVVEFYSNFSLNPKVYKLVKDYSQTGEAKALSGERKRHLENTLKGFVLAGAELEGKDKEEFKELSLKLADLTQKFSDNATDSKFELIITDDKDLSGLPDDVIKSAKALAANYKEKASEKVPEGAALFNLDYPSYAPFMKFSDRSNLKKQLYIQYLNKGTTNANKGISSNEKVDLNNEGLIKEIFEAKTRKAHLLGFKNYAEYSLETKMAESPKQVSEFIERLAAKAKPLAQKQYQALVDFQKKIAYNNSENNPDKVYAWDFEYLSEKLRKAEYDFDTNETKPYFEVNHTLKEMFKLSEDLFDIKINKVNDIEVWHEDVEVYEVVENSQRLGVFYVDLYPRDIKRQGAWMMPIQKSFQELNGSRKNAQCVLSCNLTKATGDQPSLLNHLEVTTMYHEFGHSLHHLLSKTELESLSGTDVEWDFVELPSQLFENFVCEKEGLKRVTKHHETGEPMPDELIEKILAAKTFNEGLACIRQSQFALFDFAIYTREKDDGRQPNDIFREIVDKYGVVEMVEGTNFPCAFSHIFAGGYSAGYYSYKWAEVLDADAFSRFQKEGILNKEVGKHYKETILEKGDSEPPMDLFKAFMGREPSEDALLARMGL